MKKEFKEMMVEKSFEFTEKFRDELMNADHLDNLFKSMSDDELHIAIVGLQALVGTDSTSIASQWVKAFIRMNNELLLEEYENSKKAAVELEQKYGSSTLATVYRQMVKMGQRNLSPC